mgnify:CR=1 FL=1
MNDFCGTYEASLFDIVLLIVTFEAPGISILLHNYPHITFKEIIISGIMLGITTLGIIYIFYRYYKK